jgi:SAM-dependent methyltransferase
MSELWDQPTEELARYYGWDEDLSRLLLCLPRPVVDQYIQITTSYESDGWHYILPELPSPASVVCLDARYGATAAVFAERGASVTVIHPCATTARIIERRLAWRGISGVVVIHVPPEAASLPFEDASFDAYIHHDVEGTLGIDRVAAKSPFARITATLLNEVHRLLRSNGFAYFGIKNPHSYREWQRVVRRRSTEKRAPGFPTSIGRAKRLIKQAGFRDAVVYPYLVERGRVNEIVPSTGYRSVKNSFLATEKLKQILFGRIGSRHFAPAYGLMCAKGPQPAMQIQAFADDLVARGIMMKDCQQARFRRYVCLQGKVFVSLGKAVGSDENIMIVIPKTLKVEEQRKREIEIVNQVRALSPSFGSKVPRLYLELACRGEAYFALSEIVGITVDRRGPYLERLTRNAVEFLIRFNEITAHQATISPEAYSGHIGSIPKQVAERYPETRESAERIDGCLRATLVGKSLVNVWFHGDYKLENLIFERTTLDIASIIDWEYSLPIGLPWLDLFYLITYNRFMTETRSFFDIYRDVVLDETYSESERSLMGAYAEAMPVTEPMKFALAALFFLHHIGFRYQYDMRMAGDRDAILTILDELERRLANLT